VKEEFFSDPNWYKYWGGTWSLLTCSYWGEVYTRVMHVGRQLTFLDKTVFVIDNGSSGAWTPQISKDRFGTYLARQIEADARFALLWSELLKVHTDRIRSFMAKHRGQEVSYETYKAYLDMHYDYYIPHIRNKFALDYMDSEQAEKLLPVFQEARLYAEPVFKETEEFLVAVCETISHKTAYPTELLLLLLKEELHAYFEGQPLPTQDELEKRKQCVLLYDQKTFELVLGEEAQDIVVKLESKKETNELKGTVAYSGKVTGRVRVVRDPRNAGDFLEGDILVAGMTRPDYLSLMKKAAAFITDSGGILCHAAIVARELNKPCVIGTKVATSVFKDGDIVEVDATNGTVRKIG
jgi:phosphohistidine swiveling domain-containing protein